MGKRTLATLAFVAALTAAVLAPSRASAATVCQGPLEKIYYRHTVTVRGQAIARVWMHWSADGQRSCTVLRALKWKGTPHYMFLRVCRTQVAPRRAKGCSGWDAGLYSYYAGPVWHNSIACQAIRIKVDSPSGRRVVDRFVSGPCD